MATIGEKGYIQQQPAGRAAAVNSNPVKK